MRLSDFIPSVSFCVFRGRFCLLLLGVFLSLGGSAFADTLKCTMVSKSVILREGGFIPMDFSLEYEGRGFQEGRFEVEIVLTGEVLSRTRSPELVIAAGDRGWCAPRLASHCASAISFRSRDDASDAVCG